ncbi:Hypothetical_protein [Hexamita inflata]|uniref:Hypothetical_protein n=1 Tax=Hexamita inflata TaxID=28002 RepID=A0AA86PT34_9EUKA|nr:Hypothetical protein HINF_LOCUS33455 [Hexamita inflata]
MPKLPDGFEGVILPDYQIMLSQFITALTPYMEKYQKYVTLVSYHVVPFIYAFTISSKFFKFTLYPLLYVVPWILFTIQKDKLTAELVHLTAPFIGFVYLFFCVRFIFSRKNKSVFKQFVFILKYSFLTLLALITPIVPFNFKNGLFVQFGYPFLSFDMAFGTKFYSYFKLERIMEFVIGAVAIPMLGHVWYLCAFCVALALLRMILAILKREKKDVQEKKEEEKTE